MKVNERISGLRGLMKKAGIQAYLVPSTDPHQSEYVPDFWRRREWISGFTGSAGDVAITLSKGALWTDSRYFLQAEQQLKGSGVTLMKMGEPQTPTISGWLAASLKRGDKVGVDAQVLATAQFEHLRSDLESKGFKLVSVRSNLVDALWADRPAAPQGKIEVYPVKYAGEKFQDKLKRLRKAMLQAGANVHVVSTLDAIAWLFNIRGTDVEYNPLVISYALVTSKRSVLFTDRQKASPQLRAAFGKAVEVKAYESFAAELNKLSASRNTVWLDKSSASQWMIDQLSGKCKMILKESPITKFKAVKNKTEITGIQRAHNRDGVAMARFFYWFERNVRSGELDEIGVADKLEEIRAKGDLFRGLSFDTIAGYGPHGAIIHYSSTPKTNVKLKPQGIFLLDSGAQYLDGTTDITRTVTLSKPTPEQKDRFTRVLKAHIAVATASFPMGTTGRQLDTLARNPLWEAGLNYGHGTGHGVGAYLSVHESPPRISPAAAADVPLEPGMVVSNEPGYYKTGAYGIRTETLIYVIEDKKNSRAGQKFYKFETFTLCPIDLKLIEKKLMTKDEVNYLNTYHERVRKTLSPHLSKDEREWLVKATRPI